MSLVRMATEEWQIGSQILIYHRNFDWGKMREMGIVNNLTIPIGLKALISRNFDGFHCQRRQVFEKGKVLRCSAEPRECMLEALVQPASGTYRTHCDLVSAERSASIRFRLTPRSLSPIREAERT
jgi:hypothetical protein